MKFTLTKTMLEMIHPILHEFASPLSSPMVTAIACLHKPKTIPRASGGRTKGLRLPDTQLFPSFCLSSGLCCPSCSLPPAAWPTQLAWPGLLPIKAWVLYKRPEFILGSSSDLIVQVRQQELTPHRKSGPVKY